MPAGRNVHRDDGVPNEPPVAFLGTSLGFNTPAVAPLRRSPLESETPATISFASPELSRNALQPGPSPRPPFLATTHLHVDAQLIQAPSPAASPTTFPRSSPRPRHAIVGTRDPSPPHHQRLQRIRRRAEPVVKKVKPGGHTFAHHRLRVLLHAGGVTWPTRPQPERTRIRTPHRFA
jgi:hypothetical protein